jgi:uncharacterized protein YfbU (UPF0304 family)
LQLKSALQDKEEQLHSAEATLNEKNKQLELATEELSTWKVWVENYEAERMESGIKLEEANEQTKRLLIDSESLAVANVSLQKQLNDKKSIIEELLRMLGWFVVNIIIIIYFLFSFSLSETLTRTHKELNKKETICEQLEKKVEQKTSKCEKYHLYIDSLKNCLKNIHKLSLDFVDISEENIFQEFF